MFDEEFYPTPDTAIRKMIAPFWKELKNKNMMVVFLQVLLKMVQMDLKN